MCLLFALSAVVIPHHKMAPAGGGFQEGWSDGRKAKLLSSFRHAACWKPVLQRGDEITLTPRRKKIHPDVEAAKTANGGMSILTD